MTSPKLEKVLATLAEREAAKDQLSGQVTHYRAVLAQTETTLTSLQNSVEKEQLNLDNVNRELDNSRQELDTAYKELNNTKQELENATWKIDNVYQEIITLKLENSRLSEEQLRPKELEKTIEIDLRGSTSGDEILELSIIHEDARYDFRISKGPEDIKLEEFIERETGAFFFLDHGWRWEVIE